MYSDCIFEKGVTLIPTMPDNVRFHYCRFRPGSIIRFEEPVRDVKIIGCTFDSGSMMDLGQHCVSLTMSECNLPKDDTSVFHGMTNEFNFSRFSPDEPIPSPFLEYRLIWVSDGCFKYKDWELGSPMVFPPNTYIMYSCDGEWTNPKSMDNLVHMLWKYPKMSVTSIHWCGRVSEYVNCRLILSHPCRKEASQVFAILTSKLFPVHLIRNELVGFLI